MHTTNLDLTFAVLPETVEILSKGFDLDLLKRCYFIGYGPAQIAATMSGLAPDSDEVRETSDFLGYEKFTITLEGFE